MQLYSPCASLYWPHIGYQKSEDILEKLGHFFWPEHGQGLMVKIWFGLGLGQGVRWDW